MVEFQGKYGKAKVMIDGIDQATISQIYEFLNHELFTNPIAIMPDTHAGNGAVIGFTMEMTNGIIPNVVGVDISCGMLSFNIGTGLSLDRKTIDERIRETVPFGTNVHNKRNINIDNWLWKHSTKQHSDFSHKFNNRFNTHYSSITYTNDWLKDKCKDIRIDYERVVSSLGTLGSGNHFIELGESEKTNDYWFTVHSGSRQFGLKVCNYWQKKAGKGSLAYLTGDDMFGYLTDMIFVQNYAQLNRSYMMLFILEAIEYPKVVKDKISTNHNFINFDDFIIRKGAISSYNNQRMIIPFNMLDGILICEGKTNEEWNFSAPHGAGRVGSRRWAKENLSLEEAEKQMKEKDIYFSKLPLDETSGAYKNSKIIESSIEPTATIIDRLKPIISMKD